MPAAGEIPERQRSQALPARAALGKKASRREHPHVRLRLVAHFVQRLGLHVQRARYAQERGPLRISPLTIIPDLSSGSSRWLENRLSPEEFEEYLAEENQKAEPFIPLKNCSVCGKPIQEEVFVIDTNFDPPRWCHEACTAA